MTHEPRLSRELRKLLSTQRVAALGTIDDAGTPFVSMVPFAVDPRSQCLLIHVSGLAAHTRNLQARNNVSLMVMQSELAGQPVHALPRVTLEGMAKVAEQGSSEWVEFRTAYLTRFPEAEPMTALGDFRFVAIEVSGARQVAGFGAARSLDEDEVRMVLGTVTSTAAMSSGAEAIDWQWQGFAQLSGADLYEVLSARQQVFVLEQKCMYRDMDGLDQGAHHLLGWRKIEGKRCLAAYLRCLAPGAKYAEISLGRVLTTSGSRGTGVGCEMMAKGIACAEQQHPGHRIRISAQAHLQRFYAGFGFEAVSAPYDEDGILHIDMLR